MRALITLLAFVGCAPLPPSPRAPTGGVRIGQLLDGKHEVLGEGVIVHPAGYCVTLANLTVRLEPTEGRPTGSVAEGLLAQVGDRWVETHLVRADVHLGLALLKLVGEAPFPRAELREEAVTLLEPVWLLTEHWGAPLRMPGQIVSLQRDAAHNPTTIFADLGAPHDGAPLFDAGGRAVALVMSSRYHFEPGFHHAVSWARPLRGVLDTWLSSPPAEGPQIDGVGALVEGTQRIVPRRLGPALGETHWLRIDAETAGWVEVDNEANVELAVIGPSGRLREGSSRIALRADDEAPAALRVVVPRDAAAFRLVFRRGPPPDGLLPRETTHRSVASLRIEEDRAGVALP